MKITIITLFPSMFEGFLQESIVKRAVEKKAVEIEIVNLRDFAINSYGQIDDKPYGGGAGMVLMAEPVVQVIRKIKDQRLKIKSKIILTSARGETYSQKKARDYSELDHLIILAGHYEGIDERVMEHIDEEVSIGDFVLTGGELPAAMIVDSVVRLLPGVLKKEEATTEESFFQVSLDDLIAAVGAHEALKEIESRGISQVTLLEYPHYTRPIDFEGSIVPEVLTSGNHHDIRIWKLQKAFYTTLERRPDLFGKKVL